MAAVQAAAVAPASSQGSSSSTAPADGTAAPSHAAAQLENGTAMHVQHLAQHLLGRLQALLRQRLLGSSQQANSLLCLVSLRLLTCRCLDQQIAGCLVTCACACHMSFSHVHCACPD